MLAIARECNRLDPALGKELDAKAPFNAEIQGINKETNTIFILLFSIRYFFLSVQGTYGKSLISKAEKIDKLPEDKRNLEIQSWRSKQRPAPVTEVAQTPHRPAPPVPQQDFRTSTPKSSSPPKRMLHGQRGSREGRGEDPCLGSPLTKLSPGQHLLEPHRTLVPDAYSRDQNDVRQPLSRGSHRRSQSSLTI